MAAGLLLWCTYYDGVFLKKNTAFAKRNFLFADLPHNSCFLYTFLHYFWKFGTAAEVL